MSYCIVFPCLAAAAFSKGQINRIKSNKDIQKRHFDNKQGVAFLKRARYATQMLMIVVISYGIIMQLKLNSSFLRKFGIIKKREKINTWFYSKAVCNSSITSFISIFFASASPLSLVFIIPPAA
jgi:hypothetical protein